MVNSSTQLVAHTCARVTRVTCARMRVGVVVGFVTLAAAVLAGCGGGKGNVATAADSVGPPQRGGEITAGFDQEPQCLNNMLTCGGMATASYINNTMIQSWIGIEPDGTLFPRLITEIPTIENGGVVMDGKGMSVTMHIRPETHWSDNHPIQCDDFEFKWKTVMNKKWLIGSKVGWEKIESVDCSDPLTVVIHFTELFAPYVETILGSAPLPKHELDGKDFNSYWNDKITVTNGPFVFEKWSRNVEIVVKRNKNYWDAGKQQKPYLDRIHFKFIRDTNTIKIQLRTGEVDYILPAPDTSLSEEIKSFPRSSFQVRAGIFWEHLAFQMGRKPLNDKNVRKALAYALDRKTIADIILRKQVTQLDSTLLPDVKTYYKPAWSMYKYSPTKVTKYMKAAGYKREGDGLWKKNGKSLNLTFKSTAGNALRMRVSQLLQQQFLMNGIDMTIVLEQPGVLFSQSLPQSAFDVGDWARSSTTDPTQTVLFACDQIPLKKNQYSGSNSYHYCNEALTKEMQEADRTIDVEKRSKLIHHIQEVMAENVPLVPLYQRPEVVAYSLRLHGVINNPIGFQTWNTQDWWVSK